jgi:hypothetical protein
MVEAREVDWNGEGTPLLWRLLTTIATIDADGAAEIVRLYRLRWRIEELFRSLKSDGLKLEETQMQDAGRLFKLALIGLAAATRTSQLVDARDGSKRLATDVIDPGLLPAAAAIEPYTRRQNSATEKPSSPAIPRLACLDHRPPRRMELLLQAARAKNHARRVGPIRRNRHRLHHRRSIKCVNLVGTQWTAAYITLSSFASSPENSSTILPWRATSKRSDNSSTSGR